MVPTAHLPRTKITVRLAQADEGPLVGALVKRYGGPTWDWLDWSQAGPFWLLGLVDEEPRGCIMVNPGRPFGHIEILCVDPTLPHRDKAVLVRDLGYAAIATCKAYGCSAVLAGAEWMDEAWLKVMQRRGWHERAYGTFLVKKVV